MPERDVMIITSPQEFLLKVRVRFSDVVEKSTHASQGRVEPNGFCDSLCDHPNVSQVVNERCAAVFRALSKYVLKRVHL
jgi:hypothetical protein